MFEPHFNRVLLTGSLVSDPELRESPPLDAVCFLRVRSASSQRLPRGKDVRVNELGVVMLGPHASEMEPYLQQGCGVIVQGWLESTAWESDGGVEREALSVIAERVQLLDGRGVRKKARLKGGEGEVRVARAPTLGRAREPDVELVRRLDALSWLRGGAGGGVERDHGSSVPGDYRGMECRGHAPGAERGTRR